MKDQVTSIEQSKRLIELEVPADRASMVYRKTNIVGIVRLEVKKGKGGVVAPAFTVADLLAVLPKTIWGDQKGWIHLIIRFPNEDHCKIVYDNSYNILWKCDGSLLSCIVETIGWVITNGYRLNP